MKKSSLIILFYLLLISCSTKKQTNTVVEKEVKKTEQVQKVEQSISKKFNDKDGFYATIDYIKNSDPKDVILEDKPSLTFNHVKEVKKGFSNYSGQPEIQLTFTEKGTQIFHQLTKKNIGKPIALIINGENIFMPIVQEEISQGSVTISGNFTVQKVDEIVKRMKGGK